MRATALACVLLTFIAAPARGQLEGFLDQQSAAPGETVQVHVNSGGQHRVKVHYSPFFDKLERLDSGILAASPQPVQRGSTAIATDSPLLKITGDLTLEAWVNPSAISGSNFAGILMKYLNPGETAYGIYLMPGGQVSFYLGATGVFSANNRLLSTNPLPSDQWTHVVGTWDGATKRLYLDGQLDTSAPFAGPIYDTSEEVFVGAFSGGASAPHSFLNGCIDSPAIYSAALTPGEITTRFAERADYDAGNPGVLPSTVAQWNFQEMEATTLADATGNGHDLRLINYATRSVPGPAWVGPAIPTQWCIRFSEEDLYNPPWTPTWSFVVGANWQPGFYIVELTNQGGTTVDLPFVVKPAPGTEAAIFVLVNTNTWAAYNNSWTNGLYSTHPGGDINNYSGLLTPNTNALANLQSPGGGLAHLVDAERYLIGWLDLEGYDFDLYTDLDLHRDPNLLDPYRVFMINGHSEYWSTEEMDHLQAFQERGGSTINLSGNTMWSRVTFSQDFTMMEGRKHPWGTRPSVHPPGERWHSTGGQARGGTLRCVGRPEHELILTGFGLTMTGAAYGVYMVTDAAHWIYAGTGVVNGDRYGLTSLNGAGIVHFEADYTDFFWGTPAGTRVIGRGVDFTGGVQDLDVSDCQNRVWSTVFQGGDVAYYDHPGGGGVFAMPSVSAGGALPVSPVAAKMVINALTRFLEQAVSYCTAGTSASGCQATLSAAGAASATAATGFTLTSSSVEGDKDGLYFFGVNGRQANPWGSGTSYQCVIPPVARAGLLAASGTNGACDGGFSQDLNALWCPGCPKPAKNPGAGTTTQAQLWYRDPLNTSNRTTSLSDALEFEVGP
jgi:hypothetical protein